MTGAEANYWGVVLGVVCLVLHFGYGYWRCRTAPPFLRMGMSFLSGMGIAPVLQLAPIVARRPQAQALMIPVDDHRTTIILGLISIIALCFLGLRDNFMEVQRQEEQRPPRRVDPPSAGGAE